MSGSVFVELRRRQVFKVGAAYLVVAWLAVQVASIAFPAFEAPLWALRVFILVALLGFPVAVVLAWVFESTPDGVRLDPVRNGTKRVVAVAVVLCLLALAWYFKGQPSFRGDEIPASAAKPAESAPSAPERSIAVLPFVDLSREHDQEYFSDGIAEELLNRLAQNPQLQVAARTSAFRFKGANLDMADIGRQLNVAHVLEGSVRKDGDRLRITAQLIDSRTGFHVWSQTFEKTAADIFDVQDEIAAAIATALEAKLGGQQAPAQRVDPDAYDDYLQGRALVARRVDDNTRLAVEAFDRAIAKDPGYSPAHSGRAFALTIGSYWSDWLPREEAFARARASIDEALRLDPDNAEAYMVRGTIEVTSLQVAAGKADLDKALALAPGNVDVINFYGDMQQFTGDLRGAERSKRKAMALDPLAFIHPINLGQTLLAQGRVEDGLRYTLQGEAIGNAQGGTGLWGNVMVLQLRAARVADAQSTWNAHCSAPAEKEGPRCATLRIVLLSAQGHRDDAAKALAALESGGGKVQVGGLKGELGYAWLHLIALHDPHGATARIQAALDHVQWQGYDKLLVTSQGQKLPEEISTDPQWLAAWGDPRLKEWVEAYRANLATFREGN